MWQRSLGSTILCVWNWSAGAACILVGVVVAVAFDQLAEGNFLAPTMPVPGVGGRLTLPLQLGALAVLRIAVAGQFWRGKSKGWHLALFLHLLLLLLALGKLTYGGSQVRIVTAPDEIFTAKALICGGALGLVVNLLAVQHLCHRDVQGFAGVLRRPKRRAVLAEAGLATLLAVGCLWPLVTAVPNKSVKIPLSQAEIRDIRRALQDPDQAGEVVSTLEARLESVPERRMSALGYALLGMAYESAERAAEAERAYDRALDLDPTQYEARLWEARRHAAARKTTTARRICRELIAQNGERAEAFGMLAKLELEWGEAAQAHQAALTAWRIAPSDVEYVATLALASHRTNDSDLRDRMLALARELGYPEIEELERQCRGRRDADSE